MYRCFVFEKYSLNNRSVFKKNKNPHIKLIFYASRINYQNAHHFDNNHIFGKNKVIGVIMISNIVNILLL